MALLIRGRTEPFPPKKTRFDQKSRRQHIPEDGEKNTHSEPLLGVDHLSLLHGFLDVLGDGVGTVLASLELLHVAVNWQGGVAG